MNPLMEIWFASGVGAALFFAAGYLLSSALRRAELVLWEARLAHDRAEIEHARILYSAQSREVEHLDHRARRAEQSAEELSEAVSQARADCVRLDRELSRHAQATERAAALERQVESLSAQLRSQVGSGSEARELRARLEREQARARQLEADLRTRRALPAPLDVQRQLAEQATEAAQREVQRLQGELDERVTRGRLLSDRVARLEAHAKENLLLQERCRALTAELQRLRDEQQRTSEPPQRRAPPTSGFVSTAPSWSVPRPDAAEPDTLAGILKRQLSLLIEREPDVTAVLSDEQGLTLVGTGPDAEQERVSVATSLAANFSRHASELLELERVELMEMVDAGGRALRVRFFDWEGQPLALGYVGRPRLVQSEDERELVSTFPARRVMRSA